MKILFLTDGFPPNNFGGSGIVACNLAKQLKELGHEIYIITTVQKKIQVKKIEFDGLNIHQIYSNYHERWRAWLSLCNPQTVLKVKNIIKQVKPDIIHAHNIHQHISYCCLKIARKYAKGVFLTAHDVMLFNYGKLMPKDGNDIYRVSAWDQVKEAKKRYNPFRGIIIRHYLKYTDKIFAVSNSLNKSLEINGIKNVETIYNGVNVNNWESDLEKIRNFKKKYNLVNKKIIFFGGRLSKEKGGYQILKAVALIKKETKNIVLLVIGKKSQYVEKMNKLVKNLDIEKNVIFTGWLKQDELKVAYHSADVCVFPSLCFETFGMTNLEAMACKKPVISSYFGGPKEVIVNRKTGYLINSNDKQALAKKVINLLKNSKKAEQFGQAGYKRAKEYFSLDNQVEKTLKWYKKYA